MASKLFSLIAVLCYVAWQVEAQNATVARSPYYPPQPACKICNTLFAGFTASKAEITSITSSVSTVLNMLPPCRPTVSSDVQVVVSTDNKVTDGDNEVVACPLNYIAINCRCTSENDKCDGTYITSNGRTCVARKGPSAGEVNAIATCVPDNAQFVVSLVTGIGPNPTQTCPAGAVMIDCFIEDRSAADATLRTTVISNNICSPSTPCQNSATEGCRLTAVCKRMML